ncbi:hypothetical protein MMC11_005673 [Xylographa trunciseda]|nr:hypothetical protein [Xylographa trunciseda]
MGDVDPPISIWNADETQLSGDWILFLGDHSIDYTIQAQPSLSSSTTDNLPPTLTSKRFWDLPFNATQNNARFNQTSSIVGDNQAILLGLASQVTTNAPIPSPNDPTLSDVLEAFGVNYSNGGLVEKIIDAAATTAKLTLDTTEPRNALWCIPGQTFCTSTALAFTISSDKLDEITKAVTGEFDISISKAFSSLKWYFQRTSYGVPIFIGNDKSIQISSTFRLSVKAIVHEFEFWITLTPAGVSCTVTASGADVWNSLSSLGGGIPGNSDAKPEWGALFKNVYLLSATIGKNSGGVWWRIHTLVDLEPKNHILLLLTYDSPSKTFAGTVVFRNNFPSATDMLLPTFEITSDILPDSIYGGDASKLPVYLELMQIFGEGGSLPKSIPSSLAVASISYKKAIKPMLSFSASLIALDTTDAADAVPAPFVWNEVHVQCSKEAVFMGEVYTSFTLNPPQGYNYPPAEMSIGLAYKAGTWQLAGHVESLSCGLLCSFFPSDLGDPVAKVLGKLTLKSLDVLYTYSGGGAATSFLISGVITMGQLELRLFYQYASKQVDPNSTAAAIGLKDIENPPPQVDLSKSSKSSDWRFECDLGATNTGATVATILDSIVDNASDILPDFVKDIKIAPAAGHPSPIYLKIGTAGAGDAQCVVFVFNVNIAGFKVMFIQIASKDKSKDPKRILRVSVDKIPLVEKIPLLNQLPQPFDELIYMWVTDTGDLTKVDVDNINSMLEDDPKGKLVFKKVTTKPQDTTPAIVVGHHFVVINANDVILDHVFKIGEDETKPESTDADALVSTKKNVGMVSTKRNTVTLDTITPDNKPTKGALTKTLGPLTISAVSLQYKDKMLWLTMDATLTLGPFSLSLLGLGLGVPTSNLKLDNLKGIASSIVPQLNGLALSFTSPPMLLAGVFLHDIMSDGTTTQDVYKGGVAISFPPYTLVAVGEYAIVHHNGNEYKSIFIFAKLDGPLLTLEFATISGVRLGFGYNSVVRSPTIEQLTDFPFINDSGVSGSGNDPLKILQNMTEKPADGPWVTPKQDSYWVAAGMTITAFDILTITAVAMLAFRDQGIIVSLFADAIAQMPPGVTSPNEMILYVEIGLVAEMNFIDGYFRVEASLAPTSFLLVPQCRISGGFALVYWFGKNPHAGDWVFSIGGYHKSYTPPPYYPVPKRIKISFQIGDNLQITGESYFAITPKVAMGGALIHVSLDVGPVSAYLDASFDALINFHPLHYTADFRVSIGVTFDADVWFIHIHISASVGADLHIEGPEFGGIAHVDFYLFSFSVNFGASPQALPPINLEDFWKMVHQPGPNQQVTSKDQDSNPILSRLQYSSSGSTTMNDSTVPEAAHKFILEDGVFSMPSAKGSSTTDPASTGAGAGWFVKGGTFRFGITSDFAIASAELNDLLEPFPSPAKDSIYSRPMHVSVPLTTSTLKVTIRHVVVTDTPGVIIDGWRNVTLVTKSVPKAVWAAYDPKLDPLNPKADLSSLLKGDLPTTDLAMTVMLQAPPPVLAESLIPVFKATAAANMEVLDTRVTPNTEWILAKPEDIQVEYLAAAVTTEDSKKSKRDQWIGVKTEWQKASVAQNVVGNDTNGMIGACTDLFGWIKNRPQGEEPPPAPSRPAWSLTGGLPEKLISGLESSYLALPRLAVV